MRPVLVACLLALLAPLAHGQGILPPGTLVVQVDPFGDAAPPAGEALRAPFTVRVACEAGRAALPVTLEYRVVAAPPWAQVVLSPSSGRSDLQECGDGALTFHGEILATATLDAPAFMPDVVRVEALATQPMREPFRGVAEVPLLAGWFSIVDVAPEASVLALDTGEAGALHARVTNFGNGPTRVTFETVATDGLHVRTPPPVVLASRHMGASAIAADVRIEVERMDASERPLPVLLRWQATYALDAQLVGDAGTLSFVVAPAGAPAALDAASTRDGAEAARVPMPPVALALALAGALAGVLPRRR